MVILDTLKTYTSLLSAVLLLGCVVNCNKQDEKPAKVSTSSSTTTVGEEKNKETVLARIDGVAITVGEFQNRINKQSPYIRARYSSKEQKEAFLDNLIRFEVMANQAKKEGFASNPDVVRTMKQTMIQELMKERFEHGIKPEDIKEVALKEFYDKNPTEYHKPGEVRVSVIIMTNKKKAMLAAEEAQGVKGGSNKGFRDLVAQYSTDKESISRGGDLRYFTSEDKNIPKQVVATAFSLEKTGSVSGLIEVDTNLFYILKKTGHRKEIHKTFEQVKRQIQNRLYREQRSQAQKDYISDLKKNANIEIFSTELEKVKISTGTSGEHRHAHDDAP